MRLNNWVIWKVRPTRKAANSLARHRRRRRAAEKDTAADGGSDGR